MQLEITGPTSAEGACGHFKKADIEPYFFIGVRSQIVQRIIVRGTGGAEEHYVMRVSENGKLSLGSRTEEQKIVPRFDKLVPQNKEDTDGSARSAHGQKAVATS